MLKRFSYSTFALFFIALICSLSVQAQSTRVITNKDLDGARKKREASEVEYEKRRRELGLPSRAEEQAQRQRELEAMRRVSLEQQEIEASFQSRSAALREEIAAVEAQINYWSIQINNADTRLNSTAFITVAPGFYQPNVYYPSGDSTRNSMTYNLPSRRDLPATTAPNTIVSNTVSSSTIASRGSITTRETYTTSGIGIRARIGGRRSNVRFGYNRRRATYNNYFSPYHPYGGVVFAAPLTNYNNVYNTDYNTVGQLSLSARERLRELYATRAALLARFQVLEDEARRAGIATGVLR